MCKKFGEFKSPKMSYSHNKTLILSSICDKCGSEDKKIFEEKGSTEVLKFLDLINDMSEHQIKEESIRQEF